MSTDTDYHRSLLRRGVTPSFALRLSAARARLMRFTPPPALPMFPTAPTLPPEEEQNLRAMMRAAKCSESSIKTAIAKRAAQAAVALRR